MTHTTVSVGQRVLASVSVENSFAPAGLAGTLGAGPAVGGGGGAGLDGGAAAVGAGAGAAGAAAVEGAAGAAVGAGAGAGGGWRGRGGLSGCCAAATLSYVGLFGDAVRLICGLVSSPLHPGIPLLSFAPKSRLLEEGQQQAVLQGPRWVPVQRRRGIELRKPSP